MNQVNERLHLSILMNGSWKINICNSALSGNKMFEDNLRNIYIYIKIKPMLYIFINI